MLVSKLSKTVEWLTEPLNFAENLISVDSKQLRLDVWQRQFLSDKSKFINLLKSRRVGGSFMLALKFFIRSQMIPNYSGTFISMNLEEAKGKIEYAELLYDALPAGFKKRCVRRSRTELLFEDRKGNRSVLRSLASKPPRGRGGDVGISELPHCRDAVDIYEGALHATSRSADHRLIIESTPLGRNSIFHDISSGGMAEFSLYEVPWWQCSSLCRDIAGAYRLAPKLSTKDRVERFGTNSMRAIYASMPEAAFQRESELMFKEPLCSAFPMQQLTAVSEPDFSSGGDCGFRFRHMDGLPAEADWQWLRESAGGRLYGGFDVGRKGDRSALAIFADMDGKLEARFMVTLSDVSFRNQEQLLGNAIRAGVLRLAIDSTGLGMQLAEQMVERHGERVLPVHFTAKSKEELVSGMKVRLLDKSVRLPLKRELLAELASIEERVTDGGNIVYSARKNSDGHADMAWGVLLAVHAAALPFVGVASYEPLGGRRVSRNIKPLSSWRW